MSYVTAFRPPNLAALAISSFAAVDQVIPIEHESEIQTTEASCYCLGCLPQGTRASRRLDWLTKLKGDLEMFYKVLTFLAVIVAIIVTTIFSSAVAIAAPVPVSCDDCVYVAIAPPCRLIDTRITGTPLALASTTGWNVRGNPAAAQGGNTTFCGTGSDNVFAIDVSVASLGAGSYESYGYAQVYEYGSSVPDGAQLTLSGGYWRSGQIRVLVAPETADYDFSVYTSQGGHWTTTLVGYLKRP